MSLTPEKIEIMRSWSNDQKIHYIKEYSIRCGVKCEEVLELLQKCYFHKPIAYAVPVHNGKQGEGFYYIYNVSIMGHNIQLIWGIHEISAGDCSAIPPRYGFLAVNEYSVAAIMAKLLPSLLQKPKNDDTVIKPLNKNKNTGWQYFTN